ncbi:uncharacterized protein FA14DRAFT_185168 [Meira miltonrushii]|uniref:Uncharacterized protein n=1 Tax=Meira miltonrushii TaxID=1280837 RepID=A0A316V6Y2_9BASI|nr:uncharacterized protein FA14DRAFT_185168 [Meira miltonrushii]PWN33369.1 hypothetical protein FA14DRAFT_185168 [Meira miltonrushii]
MKVFYFAYLLLLNLPFISTTDDFDSNDFSWFTDNDNIVSSEQMHLPNDSSSPKVQHRAQESVNVKVKRITKRRRSPAYYSARLKDMEGELKQANEKLEQARITGEGSLKKPKKFAEANKAVRERLQRNERVMKGGKEYDEYLKLRRDRQRARRLAYTPEQKKLVQFKQREKEQKKRDWLKLPGNEAELEAWKLKHRASLNRHFAKERKKN